MIFEEIRSGGCCSYVVACAETCAGVVLEGLARTSAGLQLGACARPVAEGGDGAPFAVLAGHAWQCGT